jgi:triosephosphate isomerase
MIFINFKTYEKGSGEEAVKLAKVLEEVAKETQIKIIPVVQAADIKEIVQSTKLEVWTQTIDPVDFGAHTGAVLPESVAEDGASGTFLNHSENKFEDYEKLTLAVKRAKEVNLKTLIFADNTAELEKVSVLYPDFVSYEPPDLVGSETTSVATAHPEVIRKAAEISKAKGLPLIAGAGIHSREDVKKSLELGAVGVAVASGVVKADNPREKLLDLTEGFK